VQLHVHRTLLIFFGPPAFIRIVPGKIHCFAITGDNHCGFVILSIDLPFLLIRLVYLVTYPLPGLDIKKWLLVPVVYFGSPFGWPCGCKIKPGPEDETSEIRILRINGQVMYITE